METTMEGIGTEKAIGIIQQMNSLKKDLEELKEVYHDIQDYPMMKKPDTINSMNENKNEGLNRRKRTQMNMNDKIFRVYSNAPMPWEEEEMKEEEKEIAETMSDYAKTEKEKLVKSIRNMSIIGLIALIVYMVMRETSIYDRNNLLRYTYGISEALIYVTVLMFPLYTTGLLSKIRINRTNRKFNTIPLPGPVRKVIGFIAAFAVAALIRLLISKILL
jgi:hypothetical protein